jgi:hypothetical protein
MVNLCRLRMLIGIENRIGERRERIMAKATRITTVI